MKDGKKYDQGKLPWHLLPIEPIEKAVDVLDYGQKKYGDNTWQGLSDFENRYYSALLRHLFAWKRGEIFDKESGKSHLAHAFCNVMFLLWKEGFKK
jgi:hypothetical protein